MAVAVEVAVSAAVENKFNGDLSSMGILDFGSLRRPRGVLTMSAGASSVEASGDGLCWW